jgi:hypothetical protein
MRDRYGRVLIGLVALAFAAPSFAKDEPDTSGVICKDGATAKGGRGACRGHGGVDKVATAKAAGGATGAATETKGEQAKASMEKGQAKAAAKADEKAAEMTVVCKDGSSAKGGRGACRGHGGVDKGTTARSTGEAAAPAPPPVKPPAATPAVPPAPAAPSARATPPVPPASAAPGAVATQRAGEAMDKKGPPTARCKDGTLSHAKHHTGACARHGGVQEWLDKTEQK